MSDNPIIDGLRDAIRHARGEVQRNETTVKVEHPLDVRAIRVRMGLTQHEFAEKFGFALGTLQGWEQGRRRPTGVNRNFLLVIERLPDEVQRVLAA